jgi:hypothetical protein
MIDVVTVGHEGKRDRAWQLADRVIADVGADPEPTDDERHARRIGLARNGLDRLRIRFRGTHAIGGDFGDGPLRGRFDQFLIVRHHFSSGGRLLRRARRLRRARDHDLLARTGLAVDDGDGLGIAGIRRTVGDRRRRRLGSRRRHWQAQGSLGRTVITGGHPRGIRSRRGDLASRRSADDTRRGLPTDLSDGHRFAAKRIVSQDRPQQENAEKDRERDRDGLRERRDDCRHGNGAPAFGLPAERRAQVIGSHGPALAPCWGGIRRRSACPAGSA